MTVSPDPRPKFRVAICGAGIAGLILAITIGKYDPTVPIDLYEAHDSIDTTGVGITMWRQANEVLTDLGLFDAFKQIFTNDPNNSPGACLRRSDVREGGYVWYRNVHRYGPSSTHRQQMVAILGKNLPASCTVYSKKRLVDYTELEQEAGSAPITLKFADGTTATTDVLIGADGVRSVVRKKMFETASESNDDEKADLKQYIDATFTGITAYRYLISAETLRKEDPEHFSLRDMISYHGKGRHLIAYPIAGGTLINVVAMVGDPSLTGTSYDGRWVSDANREELAACFDDFEPATRSIVKHCESALKWALHIVKPLPFSVRKRVALIGDACHAMTPHFAAGAGQAIEDGYLLGRLIAHPLTTLDRIQESFRIYEEIRLPFVRSLVTLSLSTGWLYTFMAPGYYDGTRKEDDLDERGVSAYEREGMAALRQELDRRWDLVQQATSAVQAWKDAAEPKLQTLVGQVAN